MVRHCLVFSVVLVVFVGISSLITAANARWGNPPVDEVWFHPNDRPHYPFTNFYETDDYRDAKRYPRTGIHNVTPFQSLHIGIAGAPCLSWRSSEHFFQAMKFFVSDNLVQLCQRWNNQTPGNVFATVRGRPAQDVFAQWHNVKLYIMYVAVKAKFSQNAGLRDLLLQTNDAWIVEHVLVNQYQPQGDNYWGDTNRGQNYLGKILMAVRKELAGVAGYPINWNVARRNTMQQVELDIVAHQQTWIAHHGPALVNEHGQSLNFGLAVSLTTKVGGNLGPNASTGWARKQFQKHPVLAPTIVVLSAATIAAMIEIACRREKSIFRRLFKSKKPQPTIFVREIPVV